MKGKYTAGALYKTFGPFSVSVHTVKRGDGKHWKAYQFAICEHTFMNAGPDRFVIRYETKMKG